MTGPKILAVQRAYQEALDFCEELPLFLESFEYDDANENSPWTICVRFDDGGTTAIIPAYLAHEIMQHINNLREPADVKEKE